VVAQHWATTGDSTVTFAEHLFVQKITYEKSKVFDKKQIDQDLRSSSVECCEKQRIETRTAKNLCKS
jgi:hypothetical protein